VEVAVLVMLLFPFLLILDTAELDGTAFPPPFAVCFLLSSCPFLVLSKFFLYSKHACRCLTWVPSFACGQASSWLMQRHSSGLGFIICSQN